MQSNASLLSLSLNKVMLCVVGSKTLSCMLCLHSKLNFFWAAAASQSNYRMKITPQEQGSCSSTEYVNKQIESRDKMLKYLKMP